MYTIELKFLSDCKVSLRTVLLLDLNSQSDFQTGNGREMDQRYMEKNVFNHSMSSVIKIKVMCLQVLFEQVLATTDYQIFVKMMTKRNIMIQEQVLLMIIASTGSLPDAFVKTGDGSKEKSDRTSSPSPSVPVCDLDEERLLQQVMR